MEKDQLKEAVYAGLIGGLFFMAFQMFFVGLITHTNAWTPPKMIGAIILGKNALTTAGFSFGIVLIGMIVHFALSILFGVILAFFIQTTSAAAATIVGIIYGLILYFVNFYVFTGWFPWFANARNWITVLDHLIYGGVAGYAFKKLQVRYTQCETC